MLMKSRLHEHVISVILIIMNLGKLTYKHYLINKSNYINKHVLYFDLYSSCCNFINIPLRFICYNR